MTTKSIKRVAFVSLVAGLTALGFYRFGAQASSLENQASAAVDSESRTTPPLPSILASNTANAQGNKMQPSGTMPTSYRSRDPNQKGQSSSLKKRKGKSTLPVRGARKPINSKEEFMPDVIDIPTAQTAPAKQDIAAAAQSRWIKGLSGREANIAMAKSKIQLPACSTQNDYACDGRPADHSVNVAGVVVKTGRAPKGANADVDEAALSGDLAQGNYVEGTPAVYLK